MLSAATFPCSTWHHFSFLTPAGHGKMIGVLGKPIITPLSPTWLFCYFLHIVCLLRFLIWLSPQAEFPCFSKLFPNRCWEVLLPEAKPYHCPLTPAKSGNGGEPTQTHHTNLTTPAQHDTAIGEFFHNKITSIIMSHQKHVTADCVDVYGNIFCPHASKIQQLCFLFGHLTVPPHFLQQGSTEVSLPGLRPAAINSS